MKMPWWLFVRVTGFYIFLRGTFSLRRKLQSAFPEDEGNAGCSRFKLCARAMWG
jgi:hypothetical protein